MKLCGKRQWTISMSGLVGGLLLSGYMMKTQDGVINFWVIGLTGLMCFLIIFFMCRYANK